MSDHSELKRMAEATKGWDNLKSCWPEETEDGDLEVNWFVGGVSDDDERYPVVEVNTAQYDAFEDSGHLARFYAAANPAAVLELIAEVEGLRAQHGRDSAELRSLCQARDDARKERDQLKEEVEQLRGTLCGVMNQVDGNIRVTVRDCVNGMDDVQDIYEYCDNIEAIVDLALSLGDQP